MDFTPVFLSPRTPSEFLNYIITYHRYPTTLIIGCSKDDFLHTLALDVLRSSRQPTEDNPQAQAGAEPETQAATHHYQQPQEMKALSSHPLLHAPLIQVVVSRHIRVVFVPTVTHLRAFMASLSSSSFSAASNSKVPAPPVAPEPTGRLPLLLVYGFLELHRGASEWSAQGLSTSVAAIVDAVASSTSATGDRLRAAVMEPRGAAGHDDADQFLGEQVPILNGSSLRDDGTWKGRVTEIRKVFDSFGFAMSPKEN